MTVTASNTTSISLDADVPDGVTASWLSHTADVIIYADDAISTRIPPAPLVVPVTVPTILKLEFNTILFTYITCIPSK